MNMNEFTAEHAKKCQQVDTIDKDLYLKYGVKRGLRDLNGQGVLTGLTNISNVVAFKQEDGQRVPCDGQLWYRGYNVEDLIRGSGDSLFGFEETAYLLLFGELPSETEMENFKEVLALSRDLPTNFVRDVIMKAPSADIMNSMTKSVLTLASYDKDATVLNLDNVLRQCMMLISVFSMLAVYAYHAYNHYDKDGSMYIHRPDPSLSTAENFLRMLRPDKEFNHLEAKVLEVALILHMEHGGGNNSTFTTRVVTSSGSDTYSAIAAALCSLKGPRHGGANLMVMKMMDDIRAHVKDYKDDEEIEYYLAKILNKETFDHKGLIYGMGHAVYTLSDPRAVILKEYARSLSEEKGLTDEFAFYARVERIASELLTSRKKLHKPICCNVDFYSGFVYSMLGIPKQLYTPIFAISRIAGWSAHRIEELVNEGKIIRPAYKYVGHHMPYVALEDRK